MSVKKSRKGSGFVIYSNFKDSAYTTIKRATVPKKEILLVLPYLGLQSKVITKQLKACINKF